MSYFCGLAFQMKMSINSGFTKKLMIEATFFEMRKCYYFGYGPELRNSI